MTAGALIQISVGYADRMAFLCLNPSITHFKSVYKKYTNFAIEYISNVFTNSRELQQSSDVDLSINIGRDCDLVKDMYLSVDFPDIYSPEGYNFQWIERIGEYLIKEITIQIDNNTQIDKHYSEWLQIWSELTLDTGKREGYYRMIGNTIDMYNPAQAPGNSGTYPYSDKSVDYVPSIVGRRLTIPLQFWFNRDISSSFPLIALQLAEFKINIKLRALYELYTIIDIESAVGSQYRVRPYRPSHSIGNFVKNISIDVKSLDINPKLEINNIFLDNDERKRFASHTHEYLITQIQRYETTTSASATNPLKIDLKNISKPVTQLAFIVRRDDLESVNQWSNFTNWNLSIAPYSVEYSNINGPNISMTSTNFQYYKDSDIVRSADIYIQGQSITHGQSYYLSDGKDKTFYNNIVNYSANKLIPSQGIYTYSFSLTNDSKQPDGAINMSNINDCYINLYLNPIDPNASYVNGKTTYGYHIYVFAINYEIIRFIGGMASVAYSN